MVKTHHYGGVKPVAAGCATSNPGCIYFPTTSALQDGLSCISFVPNPSFETGLSGWSTNNVNITGANPFEGTQEVSLGPNVASMFTDIPIDPCRYPLLLSFNTFATSSNNGGNLVAEILWLNKDRQVIAAGLRLFIPENRINTSSRITYFAITDRPPSGAVEARLQFSKGTGTNADLLSLDQVILTPVSTLNLVQNSGFELGLTHWTATSFVPDFFVPYEGAAQVHATNDGTLYQDIPLHSLPARRPFLFSFAAAGSLTSLSAQVLWLNQAGNQIGPPGINLFIPGETFVGQNNNYLTYLDLTQPAPAGAVTARILFADTIAKQTDIFIDKVILAGAKSPNLIQNHSFENGLSQWTAVNTTAVISALPYEGSAVARVDVSGGLLFQDVLLPNVAAGRCLLLSFGLRSSSIGVDLSGDTLAEVRWLDSTGKESGLGLSLVVPSTSLPAQWLVYCGITEPVPPGVVTARVKFTRSPGSPAVVIDIDKVVLGLI